MLIGRLAGHVSALPLFRYDRTSDGEWRMNATS